MTRLTTLSGTPVSALCFGAMQFGGTADEPASRALYDACRAAGIDWFDTAHAYTEGRSERYLGTFAASERDTVYLATKANYDRGAGRANILQSLDESRARLGTDVIDLLYLHRWDPDTPLEESFETLAGLQAAGTVRHLGVSNYAAWQVMKAQAVAASFGTRIDVLQPMYNLVKRQAEVELLPMCADQAIGVAPYSPLGGGLLTGKYLDGSVTGRIRENDMYARRYAPSWMHRAAADLVGIARETGHDPATLAVAWVAAHPAVTAPIVSARSVAQLRPSLAAATLDLDPQLKARLDALAPAPPPATDRLEEA